MPSRACSASQDWANGRVRPHSAIGTAACHQLRCMAHDLVAAHAVRSATVRESTGHSQSSTGDLPRGAGGWRTYARHVVQQGALQQSWRPSEPRRGTSSSHPGARKSGREGGDVTDPYRESARYSLIDRDGRAWRVARVGHAGRLAVVAIRQVSLSWYPGTRYQAGPGSVCSATRIN